MPNAACPGCARLIPYEVEELPLLIECQECSTRFQVKARVGLSAPPLRGHAREMVTAACPGCARAIHYAEAELPLTIECKECGTRFDLSSAEPHQDISDLQAEEFAYDSPLVSSPLEWLPVVVGLGVLVVALVLLARVMIRAEEEDIDTDTVRGAIPHLARGDMLSARGAGLTGEIQKAEARGKIIFKAIATGVVLAVIMVLVARDARLRGVRVWAWLPVLVPLTGGLFALGWLAVRPSGYMVPCARCGGKRLAHSVACPYCGAVTAAD